MRRDELGRECYGSSKSELSGSMHTNLLEQYQWRKLSEMRAVAGAQDSVALCILWQYMKV